MDSIYVNVGSKLRFCRENLGYTLEDFCAKMNELYGLDLNPNLIGKIERGKSRVQLHDFIYICHFYGIELKELYPSELVKQDNHLEAKTINPLFETIPGRQIIREIAKLEEPELQKIVFSFLQGVMPTVRQSLKISKNDTSASILKAASKSRQKANKKK
ncbi:MAG: helix-turn-helix transcriptional regulator [Spirochaetota bacterium]